MDDIESRIIELVAKTKGVPASNVGIDSTFEELQIDSLDKINLSFAVEEMFKIEIPDESLNSLRRWGRGSRRGEPAGCGAAGHRDLVTRLRPSRGG